LNLGKWLIEQKIADASTLEQVEKELEAEMKKAVEFAVAAPYPKAEEVDEDVYA
jgi:TPP-dependent pyruvate/acetoin dehydrogenase alpha subunit